MKKYKHLFFDLDHTLWDFERNAKDAIYQIYHQFDLETKGIASFEDFFHKFSIINKSLWKQLDNKQISLHDLKERRFRESTAASGLIIDETLSLDLNHAFLVFLPEGKHLIEGTKELLDYLSPRYQLHLLTNGVLDIQTKKIESSGISQYFSEIITNDLANALKPDEKIFKLALQKTNATLQESLMIGDNYESDVLGALNIGMDVVFFNPDDEPITAEPTHSIKKLAELLSIL